MAVVEEEEPSKSPSSSSCYEIMKRDETTGDVLHLSTKRCRDVDRWDTATRIMPSITTGSNSSNTNLMILDLSNQRYIKELHPSVCALVNLTRLILCRCEKLITLPTQIGNLSKLQVLDLMDCSSLAYLPETIGDLYSLKKLSIGGHYGSGNKVLKELPETFPNNNQHNQEYQLEELILDKCKAIEKLPTNIGNLTKLISLQMRECKCITELPSSIVDCSNLKEISFSKCIELKSLPQNCGEKWKNLEDLYLTKCKSLVAIPDSLVEKCQKLVLLDLRACKKLQSLPTNLGYCSRLKVLDLNSCTSLQSLPKSLLMKVASKTTTTTHEEQEEQQQDQSNNRLERLDLFMCQSLTGLPEGYEKTSLLDITTGWDVKTGKAFVKEK